MMQHLTIRAPHPADAPDIWRIVREHDLPLSWVWPEGKHGLVVDAGTPEAPHVVAFCILSETIYGLVTEELWEEQTRAGFHGLTLLGREIERIAQRLCNQRGVPLASGGLVRHEKDRHIAALRKRGYTDIGVIMEKVFLPETPVHGIGDKI